MKFPEIAVSAGFDPGFGFSEENGAKHSPLGVKNLRRPPLVGAGRGCEALSKGKMNTIFQQPRLQQRLQQRLRLRLPLRLQLPSRLQLRLPLRLRLRLRLRLPLRLRLRLRLRL